MTNWAERGEQERRRLAAEKAAADAQAQQNARETERLHREEEEKILVKLRLFDELGIERTLAEIRRDLWKGKGDISKTNPHVWRGDGTVSSSLGFAIYFPEPKFKHLTRDVNGPYTTSEQHGNSGATINVRHHNGWHTVDAGDELIGIDESRRDAYYNVSASLSYSLTQDRYNLRVANGSTSFDGKDMDKRELSKFVDKSFVDYAANPQIPDFKLLAEYDGKKARIQGQVGRTFKSRYEFRY